ncbi:sodium:solute symporter family transporter [Megalodesulfovibrio paquesii]
MALTLLGVYVLLVLGTGVRARSHSVESFYVNNRASGAWAVGHSIIVSCVGASATVGVIGLAFTAGTPAFWWLGAGAIGLSLLAVLLARAVRRSGAYTLPHLVETILGPQVRPVIAAVIVVVWTAILAAQFSALGKVLGSLSGLPPLACLGLGLVLICGHTMSGQAAVMRADKLQAMILLAALAVLLAWLTVQHPAWMQAVRLEAVNTAFPLETLIYYLVVVGANYLVCPMLFGRLLSARDERSAMLGGLIGAGGLAVCAALIVAVGLACRGLVPAETPGDAVLTSILSGMMPPWMHLVVSFALISAIVSSADSCLVTAATVCSHDLLGLQSPAARRASVLALGVAGAAVSLWGKGILGFLLMAYDMFACGVVMPCVVGLLVAPARQVAPRQACTAVVLGGLFGLAAAITENRVFNYTGMSVSAIVALMGVARRPLHAARA